MDAQRAAGEALAGTLNEQLRASALLPILPAANAALVAPMQNTRTTAAMISTINLMAKSFPKLSHIRFQASPHYTPSYHTTELAGHRQQPSPLVAEKPCMHCTIETSQRFRRRHNARIIQRDSVRIRNFVRPIFRSKVPSTRHR